MINIPWHFPYQFDESIQGVSDKAEKSFKEQYPAVYRHLLQYRELLSNRNRAETGIRYEWYALQRWGAKYWDEFSKPKIVWAELSRTGNSFAFSDDGAMVLNTCYILSFKDKNPHIEDLHNLLGFLNSKVALFYLDIISSKLDETGWRWLKQFVELIPVPRFLNFQETIPYKNDDSDSINSQLYNLLDLSPLEIDYLDNLFSHETQ